MSSAALVRGRGSSAGGAGCIRVGSMPATLLRGPAPPDATVEACPRSGQVSSSKAATHDPKTVVTPAAALSDLPSALPPRLALRLNKGCTCDHRTGGPVVARAQAMQRDNKPASVRDDPDEDNEDGDL